MRGHIITALSIMSVQSLALLVLRHNAVQRRAHVRAHILIPVLVQGQRARCMLDEEVQQAGFVVFDLGDFFEDVVGNEVGAARSAGEGKGFLCPRTY
jgi:hypothetical protein